MKTIEIKNQFKELISSGLRLYVDLNHLVKSHPNYPNIKINSINSSPFELDDDELDDLRDGKQIEIKPFNTVGLYSATDKDNNVTRPYMRLSLHVSSLSLQIRNEQLEICECKCFALNTNM